MPDMEKVIKGIECCKAACGAGNCPYWNGSMIDGSCMLKLHAEALELLKEQEAIVRCKDCKHLEHIHALDELNGKKCYVCRKRSFTGLRDEDWFCADGEPKEE